LFVASVPTVFWFALVPVVVVVFWPLVAPKAVPAWPFNRLASKASNTMRSPCLFGKSCRLLKTDEFSSVFSLRACLFSPHFQLFHAPRPIGQTGARLGLVVGKKIDRRAVGRNYIKRVIRESFRLRREELPTRDLIMRARKPFGRTESAAIRAELASLWARLPR
jgi:ribonuclease P protein component